LERLGLGRQDFRLAPAGGAAGCVRDSVWSIQTRFRRQTPGPCLASLGAGAARKMQSAMTSLHEVRFPDNIAYGATGGLEFATTVVATSAGHEKRNVNWSEARARWDVASGLKEQAQIDELIAFFRARRGKAHGFRFKDWTDYKATGQLLGTRNRADPVPTGQALPVRKHDRGPHHHQAGRGHVKVHLASGWSVDTTTGLVTFGTPPALGLEITVDFEFDVPMRFDTDHMAVTIETYRLHAWQQIPTVELRT
jgi:hypothetical protein